MVNEYAERGIEALFGLFQVIKLGVDQPAGIENRTLAKNIRASAKGNQGPVEENEAEAKMIIGPEHMSGFGQNYAEREVGPSQAL